MPKTKYEKTLRITKKPASEGGMGVQNSYTNGAPQSKVKTPKSLTPMAPKKKK